MRIIVANNGLGNTMFQYALALSLRNHDKYMRITTAFYAPDSNFPDHNGYELVNIFKNVQPLGGLNLFQKLYIRVLEVLLPSIQNQRRKLKLYRLFFVGRDVLHTPESIIYYPEVYDKKYNNAYYIGFFQSFRYFENIRHQILHAFKFDENSLSVKTKDIAEQMRNCNSVALHIRRGDYLKPQFVLGFGTCCNMDYYCRAIDYICNKVDNPHFFLFSDDPEWVRENINVDNQTLVDFNQATDSWQDMYLMTQCIHNIIANSSFSWWGAWLGEQMDKIVIAPKRWWATLEHDDIVPETWVRI